MNILTRSTTPQLRSVLPATFALVFGVLAETSHSATFTVTNTSDGGDGSLRKAITDANASAGADTITFDIAGPGPHAIQPASALPEITEQVSIDGFSQPGSSVNTNAQGNNAVLNIVVDGSGLAGDVDGFVLAAGADASVLQGVSIVHFPRHGVRIAANGATVSGCAIGLRPDGTLGGNDGDGVHITGENNTVGGPGIDRRNVVSDNRGSGVNIVGPALPAGSGPTVAQVAPQPPNRLQNNQIGTGFTGIDAAGNSGYGVCVTGRLGTAVGSFRIQNNDQGGIGLAPDADLFLVSPTQFGNNGGLAIDYLKDGVPTPPVPAIGNVTFSAGIAGISGSLSGFRSSASCQIQIRKTPALIDPSGHGEPGPLVAFASAMTDGSGNATYGATSTQVAPGDVLTGIATCGGRTSESGRNFNTASGGTIVPLSLDTSLLAGQITATITAANTIMAGRAAHNPAVTVQLGDSTFSAISGEGWSCETPAADTATCTRSLIAADSAAPPIISVIDITDPANPVIVCTHVVADNSPMTEDLCRSVAGEPGCTLTCPTDVTVPSEDAACGAAVGYATPSTEGDCGAVTCAPPSGSFFPVGAPTPVTCASERGGGSCSFDVTVRDDTAPVAVCRDATVALADGRGSLSGADVDGGSTDNCGVVSRQPSPGAFTCDDLGANGVTLSVGDAAGNTGQCTATVTVADTTPPVITCPADVTVTVPADQNEAVVNYPSATATDDCDPEPVVSCSPPSGSTFPLGTSPVRCTAADASGNSAECTFDVTVNQAAAVACSLAPASDTNEVGTLHNAIVQVLRDDRPVAGATVNFAVVSGPNAGLSDVRTTDVAGMATFTYRGQGGVGRDVIRASGTVAGQEFLCEATKDWVITPRGDILIGKSLVDPREPGFGEPPPRVRIGRRVTYRINVHHILANAPNSGVVVADTLPAGFAFVEAFGVNREVSFTRDENVLTFDIGTMAIDEVVTIHVVVDTIAEEKQCNTARLVAATLNDDLGDDGDSACVFVGPPNQPPTARCKDVTVNADAMCRGRVSAAAVGKDSSDPDGTIEKFELDPPGPYPLGVTKVKLTVTDNEGATDSCEAFVTVEDNTPPTLECPAGISVTVPPGQGSAVVTFAATATDNCDRSPTVVCDPPSGTAFLVGTTTVRCTATDASGNTARCEFGVTVTEEVPPPPDVHDLAVAHVDVPSRIVFGSRQTERVATITVIIQNLGTHTETIATLEQLRAAVTVEVQSLGSCDDVEAELVFPHGGLPLVLPPNARRAVAFHAKFDCANDPQLSRPRDRGHEDYFVVATVNHAAVDPNGRADDRPENDRCPRAGGTRSEQGCGDNLVDIFDKRRAN